MLAGFCKNIQSATVNIIWHSQPEQNVSRPQLITPLYCYPRKEKSTIHQPKPLSQPTRIQDSHGNWGRGHRNPFRELGLGPQQCATKTRHCGLVWSVSLPKPPVRFARTVLSCWRGETDDWARLISFDFSSRKSTGR
jgi:hypothetical protein